MGTEYEKQKAAARKLGTEDLERHARVSTVELESNGKGKRCLDCFCCAAWEVLAERRASTVQS